jgi:hypothetical protein
LHSVASDPWIGRVLRKTRASNRKVRRFCVKRALAKQALSRSYNPSHSESARPCAGSSPGCEHLADSAARSFVEVVGSTAAEQ